MNRIFCGDARCMDQVADESVHLVVTSPPYNVGKGYKDHDDQMSMAEYMKFLGDVWSECKRVLVPGGRLCINVANVGRKPYVPLSSLITVHMLQAGWLMRGEIIWDKGSSAGVSTSWGSFASSSDPILRDVHEYILVFSKGQYRMDNGYKTGLGGSEFATWTKSVWRPEDRIKKMQVAVREKLMAGRRYSKDDAWLADKIARAADGLYAEGSNTVWMMRTESNSDHPAPFPVELPRRLIQIYTKPGDVVLDPFMGSGSTAVAAVELYRRYIGYEISPDYCRAAEERVAGAYTLFQQQEAEDALVQA